MSKRVRGPVRTHRRPGARPPSERGSVRRRESSTESPSRLEAAEVLAEEMVLSGDAELSALAQTVDRGAAQTDARPLGQSAARGTRVHHKIKAGSLLAARAATEYVYVSQDMRRILLVAGGLFGVLFVLWLLIVVMRVVPLPFY